MSRADPSAALQDAIRLLHAGQVQAAEQVCRGIVKRHARHHAALAVLGQIASMSSRHEEAVRLLGRAVAAAPREIDYHVLLGEALTTQGRFRDALARYDKALKLRGDHAPALAGKANALVRTRAWDEARALLGEAVEAGREDAGMALVYARIAVHDGRTERAVEVAARHLDDAVSPEIRRSLWFDIARAHEAGGRYDDAFEAYSRGNALGGATWDPQASSRRHDRIMEVFTAETLRGLPVSGNASPLPVFVVGMPRSGSTLVEQIIDAHPEAHGAGELVTLPDLLAGLGRRIGSTEDYPGCVPDLDRADVNAVSKAYLDELRRHAPAASRICDKQLGNYVHLGLISRLLPGARLIHCRRNPLDTCLSCHFQKFAPSMPAFSERLEHVGMLYNDYLALMAHWRAVLPAIGVDLLEVDYEALVDDQEAWSRRIVDHVGLPWSDRCLRFWESGRKVITMSHDQVSRPIYRDSVRRHERFAAHLGPLRDVLERGVRGTG